MLKTKSSYGTALKVLNNSADALTIPLTIGSFGDAFPALANSRAWVNSVVYPSYLFAVFGALDAFWKAHKIDRLKTFRKIFNAINDGASLSLFLNQFVDEVYSAYFCKDIKDNECYAPDWVYWSFFAGVSLFGIASVAKTLTQNRFNNEKWFRLSGHFLDILQNASIFQTFPSIFIPATKKTAATQTYVFIASGALGALPTFLKVLGNNKKLIDGVMSSVLTGACLTWFIEYLLEHNDELLSLNSNWAITALLFISVVVAPVIYDYIKKPIKDSEIEVLTETENEIDAEKDYGTISKNHSEEDTNSSELTELEKTNSTFTIKSCLRQIVCCPSKNTSSVVTHTDEEESERLLEKNFTVQ